MLGNLLADTGLVGRAGEVFGDPFRREVAPGMTRRAFDDYVFVQCARRVRETPTLGIKLHWDQVELLLYLLRLRRGLGSATDAEVLEAVFPDPHFVWMTRDDSLAQAVSWWKSMTTGRWVDREQPLAEPRYDAAGIAGRLRRVEADNRSWRRWFDANEIDPLRLTYEQLAADPSVQARRVLEFVGVEVPRDFSASPGTAVHSDATNREWIERFRAEPPAPEPVPAPRQAQRPRSFAQARVQLVAASLTLLVLLCVLFVALPEELGDWPYNALGH